MPLGTAKKRIQGSSFENVGAIMISARTVAQMSEAESQIRQLLLERHHIHPGESPDFRVTNVTEIANTMGIITGAITLMLSAIAAISLVVGGVGIMNIMLVSVTERTREIGLRMAVGARSWDIMWQFLVEALVLCLTGGAIGIFLGWISSFLVTRFLGWSTLVSPIAIVVAVLVSAGVGLVFGFYPAWKASRLDPIEALRYE